MVDKPDDVSIEVVKVPDGMILRYSVAASDVGKLIGAQGRNARSLRVIVAALGMGAIDTPPSYTSTMPRVLLNFQHYGDAWTVHFAEADSRTTIGLRTRFYKFCLRSVMGLFYPKDETLEGDAADDTEAAGLPN
jgi:hypothetical protein